MRHGVASCVYFAFLITNFLVVPIYGQQISLLKDPSDEHVQIPDTYFYIIPPEEFVFDDELLGLINPDNPETAILLSIIPGPFQETVKRFDPAILALRDMRIINEETIEVPGYLCQKFTISQETEEATYNKYIMVIGDQNQSTIIQGIAPSEDEGINAEIIKAINSIVLKYPTTYSPRDALDYRIDEKKGNFILATVLANGMVFTRDGKTPPEGQDKTVVFFDKLHTRLRIFDKEQFAIARLNQYPGAFRITSASDVKQIKKSGLKGIEILATNADNTTEKLKQIILFGKAGTYYVFTAIYAEGDDTSIADVDRIFNTFRRR